MKMDEIELKTTPDDLIALDLLIYAQDLDIIRSWLRVKDDLRRLAHKELGVGDEVTRH